MSKPTKITTFVSQKPLCVICDAVIGLQKAQEATMAWLTAVGRTHGPQLVKELRELIEETKASQKKVESLRRQLPP
jgi:hypothetical protein